MDQEWTLTGSGSGSGPELDNSESVCLCGKNMSRALNLRF